MGSLRFFRGGKMWNASLPKSRKSPSNNYYMLNESEYDLQDYADWGCQGWFPGCPPIQVTGMIEWGQKSTPPLPRPKNKSLGLQKKKSVEQNLTPNKSHDRTIMALAPNKFRAEFPSHKNQFHRNYAAEIRGNYQESSDCFEYPQNPFLNQATPKKILSKIFLPKKNPEIGNFKPQKTLPSPLSLEIRSNLPPPPVGVGYRPRRITPSDRDLYNSSAYSKVSLIIHLESFWI